MSLKINKFLDTIEKDPKGIDLLYNRLAGDWRTLTSQIWVIPAATVTAVSVLLSLVYSESTILVLDETRLLVVFFLFMLSITMYAQLKKHLLFLDVRSRIMEEIEKKLYNIESDFFTLTKNAVSTLYELKSDKCYNWSKYVKAHNWATGLMGLIIFVTLTILDHEILSYSLDYLHITLLGDLYPSYLIGVILGSLVIIGSIYLVTERYHLMKEKKEHLKLNK